MQNTNTNISKIKTYVGSDGKLHFVDSAGADSALNFNRTPNVVRVRTFIESMQYGETHAIWVHTDNKEIKHKVITNSSTSTTTILNALKIGYNSVTALVDVKYRTSDGSNSWTTLKKGSTFKESPEVGIDNSKTFIW